MRGQPGNQNRLRILLYRMFNNKIWTPQDHLNYYSRSSPKKNRRKQQPGLLLNEIVRNKKQQQSPAVSRRRKAVSLNISGYSHNSYLTSNQEWDRATDYILIQDQEPDLSSDDSFLRIPRKDESSWISIEGIPIKEEQSGYEADGNMENIRIEKDRIDRELQLRKFSKKKNIINKRKGSSGSLGSKKSSRRGSIQRCDLPKFANNENAENEETHKQMVREFSFGDKFAPLLSNEIKIIQEDNEYVSPSKLFRRLFDQAELKKLSQNSAKKMKLNKKRHFGKTINSPTKGKNVIGKKEAERNKQKQWQNFLTSLMIKNPRKNSSESGQSFQINQQEHPSFPAQSVDAMAEEFTSPTWESKDQELQQADDDLSRKELQEFKRRSLIIEQDKMAEIQPENVQVISHRKVNQRYSHEEPQKYETEASRREKLMLEAEWEQIEHSNKVNYIVKPNLGLEPDNTQAIRQKPKKSELKPITLLPPPGKPKIHQESLSTLEAALKEVPESVLPVYLKVHEKVLILQAASEKRLQHQSQIISIMQCLVSLSKEEMKSEDYVLSKPAETQDQREIRMNQVIIRGLVRKAGKAI